MSEISEHGPGEEPAEDCDCHRYAIKANSAGRRPVRRLKGAKIERRVSRLSVRQDTD